jgi:cell division protein FtsQ
MATRRLTGRGVLWRRRLVALALAFLLLYGGYMFWFRNLGWFSIDEVTVDGATTEQQQITAAVEKASKNMTTLHIKDDELRDAVAQFPTVAAVKADTSFPHGLLVTVTERLPVAVAEIDGQQVAVSADGYVLTGARFDPNRLPKLDAKTAKFARLDEQGADEAAIVGATPEALRDRLKSASWNENEGGVVVDLDGAPELRFGDGSQAAEKWQAVAAVLSSEQRGSPSYVDVSVPEKPVSGGG